jgi:cell division protein FtsQ
MNTAAPPRPPAAKPPLDPRVRARRIEVRRSLGRRRFWILVAVLAPIVLLGLGLAALYSPLVGVRTVSIEAPAHLDAAEVRSAALLSRGTPMIKVNTEAVARRIEALPLVASAQVTKQWPGTIRISVTERRAVVAAKAADGSWRTVDVTGRVLQGGADQPAMPVIEGPAPAGAPGEFVPAQAATAVRAGAAMSPPLIPLVKVIRWDADGAATLILGSGVPVRLGVSEQLTQQFISLSALLPALGMSKVESIDLTVPDHPVVTRPAPTVPTNTGKRSA